MTDYTPTDLELAVENLNFWYESHQYWVDAHARIVIEGSSDTQREMYKMTEAQVVAEYRHSIENAIMMANGALQKVLEESRKPGNKRLTFKHIVPSNIAHRDLPKNVANIR